MSDGQRVDELPLPELEVRLLIARVAQRGAASATGMTAAALRAMSETYQSQDNAVHDRPARPPGTDGGGRSRTAATNGNRKTLVRVGRSRRCAFGHRGRRPRQFPPDSGHGLPWWAEPSLAVGEHGRSRPSGLHHDPRGRPVALWHHVPHGGGLLRQRRRTSDVVTDSNPSPFVQPSITTGAYLSTDAGDTWRALSLPSSVNLNTKFSCPSATTCMVGSQAMGPDTVGGSRQPQLLLTTTDGGATWSEETVPLPPITGSNPSSDPSLAGLEGSLSQLMCFSASTCLAFGFVPSDQPSEPIGSGTTVERSVFLRTDDAGATWSTYLFPWVATPDGSPAWSNAEPGAFACATQQSCVGFSTVLSATPNQTFSGLAWRTDDGGASWAQAWLPRGVQPSLPPDSISCSDALDCVAVQKLTGTNGPYTSVVEATANGGARWAEETLPNGAELSCCPSVVSWEESVGWLAGSSSSSSSNDAPGSTDTGVILESTDSGTSWNTVALPMNTGSVNGISCPSAQSCFAIAGPSSASPTSGLGQEFLTNASGSASS